MEIVIGILNIIVMDCTIIYNMLYKLFGPCLYLFIIAYILYFIYPHSILLQYIMYRIHLLVSIDERFPIYEYEIDWLNQYKVVAMNMAMKNRDFKTIHIINKLNSNYDKRDLFDFIIDYTGMSPYEEIET